MSDAANGGAAAPADMGAGPSSPFVSQPGVTVDSGQGAPQGQPARMQPQRARVDDLTRLATGEVQPMSEPMHTMVPENPSDPWSGLVERSIVGAKGMELARAEPRDIEAEAQAFSNAQQSGQADLETDHTPSFEGDVLDSESARAEMRANYETWKRLMEADDLGEPLMSKYVTANIDGQSYRIPVAEAVAGYQRQRNVTKKFAQLYEKEALLDAEKRGLDRFLGALDRGESFLDMMVYAGKFQGFHEAAMIYGAQLAAERQMSPEQKAVLAAERRARADAYRLRIENENLQKQLAAAQQQGPSQSEQQVVHQLQQLIPDAGRKLAARGVRWVDSELSRKVFEQHFEVNVRSLEGPLTSDFIADVMQSVIDELGQYAAAGYMQPPQPTAAAKLPPVSQTTGPVQPLQNGQNGRKPRRERIGDLGSLVTR